MTLTVLQLSDTHLAVEPGRRVHGIDPDARLDAVLSAWADTGERADLVLLTGDNADDGSVEACERLAGAVEPLGAPLLATSGNHDLPRTVGAAFGQSDTAELDGWRVLTVDTTVPGEGHGSVETDAVAARLDGLDDRPTLLGLHHPPLSTSTSGYFQLHGGAELLDALAERPQVRALVGGHLHQPFELVAASGLPVLGCPSVLMSISHHGADMDVDDGGPTGARVLYLEPDGSLTSRLIEA